jgi:hypothetical protein
MLPSRSQWVRRFAAGPGSRVSFGYFGRPGVSSFKAQVLWWVGVEGGVDICLPRGNIWDG